MPLPQQELAFVPVQLRCEPALPSPIDDLQGIVQQGLGLFNLSGHLTCTGQEGDIMGHKHLRPSGTESGRSAAQERDPLHHITILNHDPPR